MPLVINNTDPLGRIIISFVVDGHKINIIVPDTEEPFDLDMPLCILKKSQDFIGFLQRETLLMQDKDLIDYESESPSIFSKNSTKTSGICEKSKDWVSDRDRLLKAAMEENDLRRLNEHKDLLNKVYDIRVSLTALDETLTNNIMAHEYSGDASRTYQTDDIVNSITEIDRTVGEMHDILSTGFCDSLLSSDSHVVCRLCGLSLPCRGCQSEKESGQYCSCEMSKMIYWRHAKCSPGYNG